jgi:uncharacterized OB-fold protein
MSTATDRPARPAPRIQPRDRPFWDGCARGELHVIRCDACGQTWFPSQHRCPNCGATTWQWVPVKTTGILYTFTVVHQAGTEGRPPGFEAPYPYVVGVIEIDGGEGARIAGNIVGLEPDRVRIGMRVRAVFSSAAAELPDFVPEA